MIIGITGTLGAGKGTVVEILKKKGFKHFSARDRIVEDIKKRGLEINRDSMVLVANELRKSHSPSFIAEELYNRALVVGGNAVIESLRTTGEVESLRKKGIFFLVSVDADPKIRYERILKRGLSTDKVSYEKFIEDENREMNSKEAHKQNIFSCMKLADFRILNNGTIEDLQKEVENILKKINGVLDNYHGIIIEESLKNNEVLQKIKIIKTKIEQVTQKHKTPWIKQWTLHTVEIPVENAAQIAKEIMENLDEQHNWYADFKNSQHHFIIFKNKIFFIDKSKMEEYERAKEFGISLGIPAYQLDFSSDVL